MKYSYDETGLTFSYFILTLLALFLVPTTYALVAKAEKKGNEERDEDVSQCPASVAKKKRQAERKKKEAGWVSWRFIAWCVAMVAFIAVARHVHMAETVEEKLWDPFEILGISPSATDREIKKAHRKFSVMYHPDKCELKEAECEEKFIAITKAYKALTNEEIRKCWEQYGNPDCTSSFDLGIGLPVWLVENPSIVLGIYGLIFGIMMPYFVGKWWYRSKRFTKDKVLNQTMATYYHELQEKMTMKKLIEVLSISAEFKDELEWKKSDTVAVPELFSYMKKEIELQNPSEKFEKPKKYNAPYCVKAFLLLNAHFYRVEIKNESLRQDQEFVIEKSMHLTLGMLQITLAKGWLQTSMMCMTLVQMLVQGQWDHQSELLQLPYMTSEILKHCKTKKRNIKNVDMLLRLSEDERKSLLRTLSEVEYEDLMKIAKKIPTVSIPKAKFKVLGEESVIAGALVTLFVTIELNEPGVIKETKEDDKDDDCDEAFEDEADSGEGGGCCGGVSTGKNIAPQGPIVNPNKPIHAPYFPLDKRPFWWLILGESRGNSMITLPIKIHDLVDKKTVKMQFQAPFRPGTYSFSLFVKSDSFVNAGVRKDVKMQVVDAKYATKPAPEDVISEDEDPFGGLRQSLNDPLSSDEEDEGAGVGH